MEITINTGILEYFELEIVYRSICDILIINFV